MGITFQWRVSEAVSDSKSKIEVEMEERRNLFVLMKGDPDVDFVHGLPENEGAQCHPEVRRHSHHLSSALLLPLRVDQKQRR